MLVNANSRIKVLVISHVFKSNWHYTHSDHGDANMHRFPHYYYVRESTHDCIGRVKVLGVPMEFERCMADMSSSTILQHRG
jgi:hypothetical protein